MKTYLQLVNNILIRLREREVASIAENSYSKLIGIFVHDAIESIEIQATSPQCLTLSMTPVTSLWPTRQHIGLMV